MVLCFRVSGDFYDHILNFSLKISKKFKISENSKISENLKKNQRNLKSAKIENQRILNQRKLKISEFQIDQVYLIKKSAKSQIGEKRLTSTE